MKGITEGKKGSAIVLSLIVVMLLMILCSTIMAFTLQNLKQSDQYKKLVGGYYSSEGNLESGLKNVQDDLKTIDAEAFNYVNSKGFSNASYNYLTDSSQGKEVTGMTTLLGIAFPDSSKYAAFTSDVNNFYASTAAKWNDFTTKVSNGSISQQSFVQKTSAFLDDVYKRYYFMLIKEIIGSSDYINSLKTSGMKSNSSTITVNVPDYNHMVQYATQYYTPGDADVKDKESYSTDSSTYNTINLVYIKNTDKNDASTAKAIEQNSIKTKIVLNVPQVTFNVKTNLKSTANISGAQVSDSSATGSAKITPNAGGNALMGDAIASYGNFTVKNGATANVYGDMFVKGSDLKSTDSDYAKAADFTDIDQDVLDANANKGGIRVGVPKETGVSSRLILRGTAYTPEYIHALGENSIIDVCGYDGNDTKGDLFKGYLFINKDQATNADLPNYVDYNANGGDVFCQKLVTEEIADRSAIKVAGRAFVSNNLQADAADPPNNTILHFSGSTDTISNSIEIDDDYYGLNSGYDLYNNRYNTEDPSTHSAVIQNGENATIAFKGKVYVPSVAYLLTRQLDATNKYNYKTAESISAAQNDTLSAYTTKTGYTTYALGAAAAPDTTDYKPFSFYTFNTGSDSLSKSTKQFLSYFTNSSISLPKSNITWNRQGWIAGTALLKNGSKTDIGVEEDIDADNSAPFKGNDYSNRVKIISNATKESHAFSDCIYNIQSAFANKTDTYYCDSKDVTKPKLNVKTDTDGNSISKIDQDDALLVQDKDVTIKSDGSNGCCAYVGGSKMKISNQGVILTNGNIYIEGGVFKGLVAANGNIVVSGDSTIQYDDKIVNDVINKYNQIARALGATVNYTTILSNVDQTASGVTSALDITTGYHVDDMSRFTRTEWTEND